MQNRIAALRHERGLSLAELAERAGTTKAQIQKLEHGHRRLSLGWMERIALALDVKLSDLLPADQIACQHTAIESALLGVLGQLQEEDRIILVRIAQELLGASRKKGRRKVRSRIQLPSPVHRPKLSKTTTSRRRRS